MPSRRSVVRWLAAADYVLSGSAVAAAVWLWRVRAYEIEESYDVAERLKEAVVGLDLLIAGAIVLAVGFAAAGLCLFGRKPGAWRFAMAWAVLMALTGIGAVYGLPAAVILGSRRTRELFRREPQTEPFSSLRGKKRVRGEPREQSARPRSSRKEHRKDPGTRRRI